MDKYTHGGLTKQILERDNHACVLCKANKDLIIDHIIPVKRGGKSTMVNQRALCQSCHSKITNTKMKKELSPIGKYLREWRKKNPNYLRNYHKKWRKEHPGYFTKYEKPEKYISYKLANI